MQDADDSERLRAVIQATRKTRGSLLVHGNGSKGFVRGRADAQPLEVTGHRGIVDYRPEELVVTVRSGTGLQTLADALHARGQRLAFDPPRYGGLGTIGGAVACGIAGPGRPWLGSVRDAVLGVEMINGLGERLRFGGTVMKNVAGFDLSRLMAGSWGSLGLILNVSLRVQPLPETTLTLVHANTGIDAAHALLAELQRKPLPLSASCYHRGELRIRLEGTASGVSAAGASIGGDRVDDDEFWLALRDHRHEFFASGPGQLWCLGVPPARALPLAATLVEWGGARCWWWTEQDAGAVADIAEVAGGHARCFRGPDARPFGRLSPAIMHYQQRLKTAFDPEHLFLSPASPHAH